MILYINPHCVKMETYSLVAAKVIHCECKLVLHFLAQSPISEFRSYHAELISAVNQKFRSSFFTKGCHLKWYFPWKFPDFARGGIEVARVMYRELCKVFARAYDGFRVMRSKELSDSMLILGLVIPRERGGKAFRQDHNQEEARVTSNN